MRVLALGLLAATTTLVAGCDTYDQGGPRHVDGGSYAQYDYDHPDPSYNGYYANRYYRDNARYRERRLSENDRIYAGEDGRYYCRRSDGTTGLIVGGIAGGALGAALTSGRSEPLGILLGAAAGAVVGNSVDRNNVRCR
ncbi:MAG: glycine zipper 2TM domain-containing protein [Sphingomonas sp.]